MKQDNHRLVKAPAALAVAAAGAAVFLLGLRLAPARAWAGLLVANFFLLGLSVFAGVFLSIQRLASATWHERFRPLVAAFAGYLPIGAAITAFLLLGARRLYPWAGPDAAHDAFAAARASVLNLPFFAARSAVYLTVWYLAMRPILRNDAAHKASKRPAALFLLLFAATFTLASMDWLMALVPHWSSTIYPWYLFGGVFVSGFAALSVLLVLLRRRGLFQDVTQSQLHDLGKCLFAFSFFWGYLWFSQYLLIWYTNIPEETAFYAAQLTGGWKLLFWANPIVNFVAPFLLLLTASAKQDERRLLAVGALVLAGRWLDYGLLVLPPVLGTAPSWAWLEAASLAGLGAVFLLVVDVRLRAKAPAPALEPATVLEAEP